MGQSSSSSRKLVVIGNIGAPFGLNGWVKVNSYTEPKDNILSFNNWILIDNSTTKKINEENPHILEVKQSKDQFLVLFDGIKDRNAAALLTHKNIAVLRKDLKKLAENEYYWDDLIGCKVYDLSNNLIGIVDYIFKAAANDIMVVKSLAPVNKEYLIPYSLGNTVVEVNIPDQKIIVDWLENN